jgi:hypothetical protein
MPLWICSRSDDGEGADDMNAGGIVFSLAILAFAVICIVVLGKVTAEWLEREIHKVERRAQMAQWHLDNDVERRLTALERDTVARPSVVEPTICDLDDPNHD